MPDNKHTTIRHVRLVSSQEDHKKCPDHQKPEFAFIGRSNVGKSSLINAILQRKQLARVSKKPGKTQLIHHYLVNDQFYLVDLPGYGWAQVSHATKQKWTSMLQNYLRYRKQLSRVFILIDVHIPPQSIDLSCIGWLVENHIPLAIIFTKADKINKTQMHKNCNIYHDILHQDYHIFPPIFCTSVQKRWGVHAILDYIQVHHITGHHPSNENKKPNPAPL